MGSRAVKKAKAAAYYQRNKERIKAKVRAYARKNKKKIKVRSKAYNRKNRDLIKKRQRAYYRKNKERMKPYFKAYHQRHRKRLIVEMKERYRRNRKARLEKQKKYYQEHQKEARAYARKWGREHPEIVKARAKEYRRKNIDRVRVFDRKKSKRRYRDPVQRAKMDRWRMKNQHRLRAHLAQRISGLKEKLGGKCYFCGYREHPEIFEFDHKKRLAKSKRGRNRSHLDRVHGAMLSPDRFNMLCPNCHAIKTSMEKQAQGWSKSKDGYWNKRLAMIAEFGAECGQCGYNKTVLALEFDHKFGLMGRKRQPANVDVPKYPDEFQLLCANCHALKTLKAIVKPRSQATG